jgi:hypothetical protein
VFGDDKIEPPIQAEYLRSGGAMTSTLKVQPDIDVAYYDAQGGGIMDATGPFFSEGNGWNYSGTPDAHGADSDDVTIWQLKRIRLPGSQTRPSPRYRSQV